MTKEELEKATGQELIEQRDYCGRDNYYYEYLENVNAEMLKRFNRLAELEAEVKEWKDKADLWCKTANLKDHNIMINKDLEKENAALKEKLKPENCLKLLAKEGYIKFTSEQLTKAKELLKQWLSLCGFKVEKLAKDTEQFLSEVEK